MRSLCASCLIAACGVAGAAVYPLPPPGEDLIGEPQQIEAHDGDTLATIAFDQALGFRAVLHANPDLDAWNLTDGEMVELPTQMLLPQAPREGIVINVPEMRLYYFPPNEHQVYVYPVAVGRIDWRTPLGTTKVSA